MSNEEHLTSQLMAIQMPTEPWHLHESSQESARGKRYAKLCGVSPEPNRTLEKCGGDSSGFKNAQRRSDVNLQIMIRDEKEGDISRKGAHVRVSKGSRMTPGRSGRMNVMAERRAGLERMRTSDY